MKEQNLGIRDIRAATEWIRDNIAAFGGNPKHMVYGGQSAGSANSDALLFAYPKDPIVKAVLLQSGIIQTLLSLTQTGPTVDSEFIRIATTVGCRNDDRQKELDCMRGIDSDRLKHAMTNETNNSIGSPPGGFPVVDNVTVWTLPEYIQKMTSGNYAQVVSNDIAIER